MLYSQEGDTDADFSQLHMVIEKSVKPPLGSESVVLKKKMRFASWIQHPEVLQSDLCKYRKTVSLVRREYDQLVAEDDMILNAMQLTRRELLTGLNVVREECQKMCMIRNAIGDKILEHCDLHSKTEFSALLKKKAVGSIPRDIVDEISAIHSEYVNELENYLVLANEVLQSAQNSARVDIAAAPSKARGKRGHAAQAAVNSFDIPIAVIELSAEEEKQAKKASETYRARVAGSHTKDSADRELAVAQDKEKTDGVADNMPSRKSSRRTAIVEGIVTNPGDFSAEIVARFAGVEEQLRYFETTTVGEIVADLFPTVDSANDSQAEFMFPDYNIEAKCMSRLNELFFGNDESVNTNCGARLSKPMKKKPRTNASKSIILTARPILNCPRGVPLLVSPAGIFPERVVGVAANTADGREGASLCQIPFISRKDGSDISSMSQIAVEQENGAISAIALRSKIIAAEVLLARLTNEVKDWGSTAADVRESLSYARERHADTQHFNASDVLAIRAQMRGQSEVIVTEGGNGGHFAGEGVHRNGFFKLSSDDDFFSHKSGKSKKSKKSSKNRQPPRGFKVETGMDILSSIAGIAAGVNDPSNSEEQNSTTSPFLASMDCIDSTSVAEDKQVSSKSLRSKRTI